MLYYHAAAALFEDYNSLCCNLPFRACTSCTCLRPSFSFSNFRRSWLQL